MLRPTGARATAVTAAKEQFQIQAAKTTYACLRRVPRPVQPARVHVRQPESLAFHGASMSDVAPVAGLVNPRTLADFRGQIVDARSSFSPIAVKHLTGSRSPRQSSVRSNDPALRAVSRSGFNDGSEKHSSNQLIRACKVKGRANDNAVSPPPTSQVRSFAGREGTQVPAADVSQRIVVQL